MSTIDDILRGAIDMHVHHGPDYRMERRGDGLLLARLAAQAGMRAIVLKSHNYPTTALAQVVEQVVPGISVFGALSLDFECGGLNPHALEAHAKLGAKVVWMPTFNSDHDMKRRNPPAQGGINILDSNGKLVPVIGDLLDIVKSSGMVLATGHISVPESFALVEEARRKGITKIVITHPMLKGPGAYLTLDEQKRMVDMGAFIEHVWVLTMPFFGRVEPKIIAEAMKTIGPEHCIMATDLGQTVNPFPAEGLRMFIASMLQLGITQKELEVMLKTNPAMLLGLK